MKWIGQHIWDFVSRFRNDIYLEDISTGTIASGGNLGLDSNNKIVKAAEVGSSVDLTSEVTGVLPVANGGTGLSTIGNNYLVTGNGASALTAESTLTYDGSIFSVTSTTSERPILQLQNDNSDALPSDLRFYKQHLSAGVDDDKLGRILFLGRDSANALQYYSSIVGSIADATNGQEAGKLELKVAEYDGSGSATSEGTTGLLLDGDTNADGEVDVTIGAGAASTTTIAGDLQVVGGDILGPTDGDLNITSDGSIVVNVDNDNDETNQDIKFRFNGSTDGFLFNPSRGAQEQHSTSSGTYPLIYLQNTGDNATGAGHLNFNKQRIDTSTQVGEDNDLIGKTKYTSYNDNGTPELITFAEIESTIKDATDGEENGKYEIKVAASNGTASSLQSALSVHGVTAPGVNRVDVSLGTGTGSLTTIAGDLDIGGDDLTFQSATSNKPSLQLKNTNGDAVAPELVFQKLSNGADGDDLGSILFKGDDVAGNVETYAQILGEINESADTDEEGKLTLLVASHDAELQPGLIIASGDAEDEVDVIVGNGSTSLTTIAGDARVTSNLTLLELTIGGHTIDDIDIGSEFVDTDDHIMSSGAIKEKIESYGYKTPTQLGINGSANQLLTDDGDGTMTSESALTWDGNDLNLTGNGNGKPKIILTAIADGNKPATLEFVKDRATGNGVLNDYVGRIDFKAPSSSDTNLDYISAIIVSQAGVIAGSEAGAITHQVLADGAATNWLTATGSTAAQEVTTTIGYGTSSICTIAGDLTLEGDQVTIAGSSSASSRIKFFEDTDNGANSTILAGAAAMGGDRTITLPDATGTVALEDKGYKQNVVLPTPSSYQFYLYYKDSWYSANSGTMRVWGNAAFGDYTLTDEKHASRMCSFVATSACTVKSLTFSFYAYYAVGATANLEFGFFKVPIADGSTADVDLLSIAVTSSQDFTSTEYQQQQKTFTFTGANAALTAGQGFAFMCRAYVNNASTTSQIRAQIYGNSTLEIEYT